MINDNAGMVENSTGLIDDNAGMIIQTNDTEHTASGRRKRSRERGPDKKPRTYKANSMGNLTQFKERPEEFATYLKDVKGIDVTGNSGIVKAFLVFGVVMIVIFGGLWVYNHYKNEKEEDIKNR